MDEKEFNEILKQHITEANEISTKFFDHCLPKKVSTHALMLAFVKIIGAMMYTAKFSDKEQDDMMFNISKYAKNAVKLLEKKDD